VMHKVTDSRIRIIFAWFIIEKVKLSDVVRQV
jgi:hypothetical protein